MPRVIASEERTQNPLTRQELQLLKNLRAKVDQGTFLEEAEAQALYDLSGKVHHSHPNDATAAALFMLAAGLLLFLAASALGRRPE